MGTLNEKIALITGAGQGIGRGVARYFAREGAAIMVAEIDAASGRRVVQELQELGARAAFVRTDVAQKASIQAAVEETVEQFGRLDVLVNNAIKLPQKVLMEQKTDEMLAQQLDIGVWGTWWGMQAAMPFMRSQGGGRIINFTSMDVQTGAWFHADYSVAKAGIQAMTRSAAIDWARYGILVNAVAPIAATAAFEQMCAERPGLREIAGAIVPLGRMGDPETDIGPAVAFLASDASRFITGATLPVDGGLNLPRMSAKPDQSVLDAMSAAGQRTE